MTYPAQFAEFDAILADKAGKYQGQTGVTLPRVK